VPPPRNSRRSSEKSNCRIKDRRSATGNPPAGSQITKKLEVRAYLSYRPN
jgi:hypothetical protein